MGEGFSLYVYSKGGRGIISVSAQQGWERDYLCKFLEREESDSHCKCKERVGFPCRCTARLVEGFSL